MHAAVLLGRPVVLAVYQSVPIEKTEEPEGSAIEPVFGGVQVHPERRADVGSL